MKRTYKCKSNTKLRKSIITPFIATKVAVQEHSKAFKYVERYVMIVYNFQYGSEVIALDSKSHRYPS